MANHRAGPGLRLWDQAMTVTRLTTRRVDKVWGRHELWPGFDDPAPGEDPVGEIWFEDTRPDRTNADPDLLVKYLFTAEKLSVQVHPDDAMAQAQGRARGKDEAWIVLAAEPDATIGIGLTRTLDTDELRAAALDGSIERLLDWRPVTGGDVFYSPSGTIHAIGAGVTLIEVQQNSDTTYRLYDYGRPRALHLEESIAAAHAVPYVAPFAPYEIAPGRTQLTGGPAFVLERWTGARSASIDADGPVWIVPIAGAGDADGTPIAPGGVWLAEGRTPMTLREDSDVLIAYSGSQAITLDG